MIGTSACHACAACGAEGRGLYRGLQDRLFGTPGHWDIKQCANARCGLLWLDPMPRADEIYKAYRTYPTHEDAKVGQGLLASTFQRAQAAYRSRRFSFQPGRSSVADQAWGVIASATPIRLHMEFPFFLLADSPKGRLLELGCGSGETMKLLSDWGWTVEGLDFDQAAVANAVAKGLNVKHGDVFSCRYPSDSFDVVFSNHVIEHVPNPGAVLAECCRVLKPGGLCIVITPNADSVGHRLFKSMWRGLEHPRHLHIFTLPSLESMTRDAGFSTKSLQTSTRLAGPMYISMMRHQATPAMPHASAALKLKAAWVHLASFIWHWFSRGSGEEIVFVGKKGS